VQQPTEIVNRIFEANKYAGLQIHSATTVLLGRHNPFGEVTSGELKVPGRVRVASVCRVHGFRHDQLYDAKTGAKAGDA
jgi:hypothetical protein